MKGLIFTSDPAPFGFVRVERDDEADTFESDEDAARALALLHDSLPVEWTCEDGYEHWLVPAVVEHAERRRPPTKRRR